MYLFSIVQPIEQVHCMYVHFSKQYLLIHCLSPPIDRQRDYANGALFKMKILKNIEKPH